jgi:hypothetical protein
MKWRLSGRRETNHPNHKPLIQHAITGIHSPREALQTSLGRHSHCHPLLVEYEPLAESEEVGGHGLVEGGDAAQTTATDILQRWIDAEGEYRLDLRTALHALHRYNMASHILPLRQLMVKKLINGAATVVSEMLDGICYAHPNLARLEGVNVLVRRDYELVKGMIS